MHSFAVYSPVAILFIGFFVLAWFKKLPSLESIHGLAEVANTKGGSILLLYFASMAFFFVAVRFGYFVMMSESKMARDIAQNPLAMALFGFITGSAFNGAFSSMLKTMTGDSTIGTVNKETTEKTTVTQAPPQQ